MNDNEVRNAKIWAIAITAAFISLVGSCTAYNITDNQIDAALALKKGEQITRIVEAGNDPASASCAIRFNSCDSLMIVELEKLKERTQ